MTLINKVIPREITPNLSRKLTRHEADRLRAIDNASGEQTVASEPPHSIGAHTCNFNPERDA